jgi:WD40 repeat protein/serine/threonine protein kinase
MNFANLGKRGRDVSRRVVAEYRRRLRQGESIELEDLLRENPEIASSADAILALIEVELAVRAERDEPVSPDAWRTQFPHLTDRIDRLLTLHSVMNGEMPTLWEGSAPASSASPAPLMESGDSAATSNSTSIGGSFPGSRRIGTYLLLEEIGRGGMGVVYKARQTNLSRIVALKMVLAGEYASLKDRARLRIEAEAAAVLHHPNVVQIFEIGEHQGLPFLALEYVPGGTLARMARGKPQSFRWAARMVETLARAIHMAHQKGIVHRDLNPSNILIASDGTPKISDFGLAKFLRGDLGLSQNGLMQGTPSYMAPEQIDGRGGGVGPATDIYALGALLYEMLTGVAPFRGLTPMETLCQVVEAEVVPPSRLRHELPTDLDTICLKCLEREPSHRYDSALELADDLKRYQDNQPVRARPTPWPKRAVKWMRRQPMIAALLGLIALLGSSLIGVIVWYNLYLQVTNQQLETLVGLERKQAIEAMSQGYRATSNAATIERQWYDAQINLAHRDQESDEPELARELLDSLRNQVASPAPPSRFEWAYIDRLLGIRSQKVFSHHRPLTSLALSRNGRMLATGDHDGTVLFWVPGETAPNSGPGYHAGPVDRIAVSADGRTAASTSASADGSEATELKIWQAADARVLNTIRLDLRAVRELAFSPDGQILTIGGPESNEPTESLRFLHQTEAGWQEATREAIQGIHLSSFLTNPPRLVLASSTGRLSIRDLATGSMRDLEEAAIAGRDEDEPTALLAVSPDGRAIAASRGGRQATVWDADSGQIRATYTEHDQPLTFLAFGPDRNTLIVREGYRAISIRTASRPSRRVSVTYRTSNRPIEAVAVSPDGRQLAAAGAGLPVTIWDLPSGRSRRQQREEVSSVVGLAFLPGDEGLVIGNEDGSVRQWRGRTSDDPRVRLGGHDGEAWTLAFSPDGATLASGGDDNLVRLWDVATGHRIANLQGHHATVTSLAFSPDGQQIVSGSLDRTVRIWSLPNSPSPKSDFQGQILAGPEQEVRSLSFSPNGRLVATTGPDGQVWIHDLASGSASPATPSSNAPIYALAFSPDGQSLATGSQENVLLLLAPGPRSKSPTGVDRPLQILPGPGVVRALAYSPDGRTLACAWSDRSVTLYRLPDGVPIQSLPRHAAMIRSLAFSADGQTLATASDDASVRLWDPATGLEFFTIREHRRRVNAVAFSPDGRNLASCSHDGEVWLWRGIPSCETSPAPGDGLPRR